ncbi:MAG: DUF5034 domain-containing protein [Bacteroidota bacterium]
MKIKKVLVVLLIPFAVNFFIACCDCLETTFLGYTHCSLTIDNLDNSGLSPVVDTSGQIIKTAFGLRVQVQRSENTCFRNSPTLFVHSAYAYDCHCPPVEEYSPIDSITSISITTLNEFDDDHPAGAAINAYFNVLVGTDFIPIEEFDLALSNRFWDVINNDWTVDLMLMVAPPERGDYQFEVEIGLSDGRALVGTSVKVDLR